MKPNKIIGSYAIIGLEYTLDKYTNNQKVYLIIDYDPDLDSYKLKPREQDYKDDKVAFLFSVYTYKGFWLKSCFVKVLGHPSESLLIKLLYES